jgi:hypothetical protein
MTLSHTRVALLGDGTDYEGSGRPLSEMLESYGLEYNAARIQRAVTLTVAGFRDVCD